jgi:hypothetical protein
MSATLTSAVAAAIPADQREATLEHVRGAFNSYRRDKRKPVTRLSVSAQRKELKKIAAYSAKLQQALGALTAEVALHLSPRRGDPFVGEHSASLEKLEAHATRAWKALANADKRKPKDAALHELLVSLVTAWSRAFPKQHGVTRNATHGNDYHGPLFDFVRELLAVEKINCADLGGRLYYLDLPWRKIGSRRT